MYNEYYVRLELNLPVTRNLVLKVVLPLDVSGYHEASRRGDRLKIRLGYHGLFNMHVSDKTANPLNNSMHSLIIKNIQIESSVKKW